MKKSFYFLSLLLTLGAWAQNIPAYYNSIDFEQNGIALKNALAQHITNTHTQELSYSPDIWNALKITDLNPDNNNQVLLIYGWPGVTSGTNARVRSKNSNGGGNGDWNREHVYAKSLSTPDLGTSGPGADAHHLRACDVQKNNQRANIKFKAGSGNSGTVSGGWFPGEEWKGDVARMMMYMYLRYGTQCLPQNVGIGNSSNTPDNMIDIFLQWNAEDPVSEVEIQRNEYLAGNGNYSQGNRNPFIDNPFLATKIWGGPLAEDTWGLLNTEEHQTIDFGLYPNPTTDNSVNITTAELINQINIFSVDGKLVQSIINPMFYNNTYQISGLRNGFYFIQLISSDKKSTKKLIVR